MIRTLIVLSIVSLLNKTNANSQKQLSIKDAVTGAYKEYAVKKMNVLNWTTDSTFIHRKENKLYIYDIHSKTENEYFGLEQLNKILESKELQSMSRLPRLSWEGEALFRFRKANSIHYIDIESNEIVKSIELPKGARNIALANDTSSAVAYTKENNLYVLANGIETAITSFKDENLVIGQVVSRNEFGIHKGIFWAPDNQSIAFYYKDETNVSEYPIIDYTQSPAKLKQIKYPRTGERSEIVRLGVYNFETKETYYINELDTVGNKYLTNITWSPNSEYIYIQELSRDQKHMKLQQYEAEDGELAETILEEKHDKYVEPQHTLFFLNDSEKFIYQSRKDGFNHLYLYDLEEETLTQLTQGEWSVTQLINCRNFDNYLYYIRTDKLGLERHLEKLELNTKISTKLTTVPGTHNIILSPDKNSFIDQYSNINTPSVTLVSSTINGSTLVNLGQSKSPFLAMQFPKMTIGKLKSKDKQTNLQCRVILPTNFDANKKYPALVYVYGGPHAQLIRNSWLGGARLWLYYMAQQGYVIFTLDNRGSANRGYEFEAATHRQLGQLEMEDQLQGVKYLKSLKYVDSKRIGVFGWSYGGYMTLSLLLNHPDAFKVGVAGGPVTDWRFYEAMYGERYMETAETNPEGYELTSTLNQAAKLKAKLLMIHGSLDPVVVQEHSMKLLREFIKEGKQVDYMLYPAHEHNIRGEDRVHLMEKISQYFFDYLGK